MELVYFKFSDRKMTLIVKESWCFQDLPVCIQRVAKFLGKKLKPEDVERLCDHLSFENFKNNESVNQEELRNQGLFDCNESFIRKGTIYTNQK